MREGRGQGGALGGQTLCRLRRRGKTAAGRQPGIAASRRQRAKGGTGHPDLRPGFLYPLLRLPLTFRSAATPFGRAANKRGTQLRLLYHFWRAAAVWGWLRASFRAYKCAADGANEKDIRFSIFPGVSVGRGDPTPPLLTDCTDLQRRHEVMPPYGSRPVTTLTPVTRPAAH